MTEFRTNITKKQVKAKHRDGRVTVHDRYVLHYNDPATRKRRMKRFELRKDAEAMQNELIRNYDAMRRRVGGRVPTLQESVDYWLQSKEKSISPKTHRAYTQIVYDYIIGPAFKGSARDRYQYALRKKLPSGCKLIPMLNGNRPIDEITTAEIRLWFQRLLDVTTTYNARLARKHMASILRLIEEDYEIRLARMPSNLGGKHRRQKRKLLSPQDVRRVMDEAARDEKWGVYYAFLFLTGVRPSEMLGLLWSDVDLPAGKVMICRTQDDYGNIKDFPKTEAGIRHIPLNPRLIEMLVEWRERCPKLNGELYRVFPAQGTPTGRGRRAEEGSDGALLLANFRNRVWFPLFDRLGIERITLWFSIKLIAGRVRPVFSARASWDRPRDFLTRANSSTIFKTNCSETSSLIRIIIPNLPKLL